MCTRHYADFLPLYPTAQQDNTVYKASTYVNHPAFAEGQKALGEFNKKVREDPRVSVVVLPIRDGISLIRRV